MDTFVLELDDDTPSVSYEYNEYSEKLTDCTKKESSHSLYWSLQNSLDHTPEDEQVNMTQVMVSLCFFHLIKNKHCSSCPI